MDEKRQEDDKIVARMHELAAKALELLSELQPQEQAAVVYALAVHPRLAPHMTTVITTSMLQELERRAQTCQCSECRASRAQA